MAKKQLRIKILAFCVNIALHFNGSFAHDNFATEKCRAPRKWKIKMMKKFLKLISILSLVAILLSSASLGAFSPPFTDEAIPVGSHYFKDLQLSQAQKVSTTEVRTVSADYRSLKLYLGGMPVGVKFLTDGSLVVGFSDCEGGLNAAVRAGLRCNDIILSIDGKTLSSVLEMNELVNSSKGMPMKIGYSRNGRNIPPLLLPNIQIPKKDTSAACRYVTAARVSAP